MNKLTKFALAAVPALALAAVNVPQAISLATTYWR